MQNVEKIFIPNINDKKTYLPFSTVVQVSTEAINATGKNFSCPLPHTDRYRWVIGFLKIKVCHIIFNCSYVQLNLIEKQI